MPADPAACAPAFDRVVVSRLIHGGTTVAWSLMHGFADRGPYTFRLEFGDTANPLADDWAPVTAPLPEAYFAVDPEQRVWGTTDWGFYRVTLATADGDYVSDPVNALGTLDLRDWNLAREVLRKERLLSRLAHQDGYLLKQRLSGPACPRCVDPQTRAPRDPDCPSCYGTGYECGYFAPMPGVWAGLEPHATRPQLDGGAGRGTVDDVVVRARMLMPPLLIDRDVWVARRTDNRYYVHSVQHTAEWRGVPLVGEVELRPVPFSSPLYALPMPGQTDRGSC